MNIENLWNKQDLPWKEKAGPVARYPWRGIGSMSLREYSRAESDLMMLYGRASRQFADSGTLPDDFVKAYRRITHPVYTRYLNYFAPDFVKAL